MTIQHHPSGDLLFDHARGALDAPLSLVVATHLALCPRCRDTVAMAECTGGILLDGIAPVALSPGALDAVLARLEETAALGAMGRADKMAASHDDTPAPLRAFLGRDLSDVRWRRLGPRLGYATLYRRGPVAMRLLRGAPGADTGAHTHRGMEYTLVLRGGFTDETGTYGPGDFQAASGDVSHNPVADRDGDCINLSVTTAPLHFDGLVQKVVGRLFGF